ncbi:PQQ-like beta-propeller repeat protein [bacterium]|nr:PQQ-like beta-propeller repeat protein [bacterium]
MKNTTFFKLGAVLVLTLLCNRLSAQDWPRFRGPDGLGIASNQTLSASALQGSPDIVWESNVGKGHGTIIIADDILFSTGNKFVVAGEDTLYEDILYCLDTRTGEELWHFAHACRDRNWPGPRSTPMVNDGLVYHVSWTGDLFGLDVQSGQVRWSVNLIDSGLTRNNRWGFCSSPVVDGDRLYLNCGKSGVAFNKKTGKLIWRSDAEICGLSTPVFFDWKGQRLGLFSSDKDLHAVSLETGAIQWSYAWSNYNNPVVLGDQLLLTGSLNSKQSRLMKMHDDSLEVLWESDVVSGWAFQNVVVKDQFVYGFGMERRIRPLQCFDLNTGELKWQEDLGVYGAFIMAGKNALILDGDGDLIVAEFCPEKLTLMASAKILPMAPGGNLPNQRKNYCWTEPVLYSGKAYVRDNYGNIACVNMTL